MKISEALNRIDADWVRKPKGFRARFNVYADGRWETDYSPEESAAPLLSDVAAWRLAWKLAQTCQPEPSDFMEGDLVNITVVDDQGARVLSYLTNQYEVYHPHEVMLTDGTRSEKKNE
jgi:hypothetical protein